MSVYLPRPDDASGAGCRLAQASMYLQKPRGLFVIASTRRIDASTQFLEGNNASEGVIFAANVAIEEIVSNTIKYGCDDARKHEIIVRLEVTENSLNMEICDDEREFNPFNEPEPNVSLRSDEPQQINFWKPQDPPPPF